VNSAAQQLEIDARRSDPKASVIVAPLPRRRRNVLIATVAALMLAGGAAVVWVTNRTPTLTDRDSIVIGQFENTTSDPVFDETLLTALKVHLGQSPFLDIIPDQRIRETLESMNRQAGDRLEHEVAREVCQRLSVKAMLEGSVAALGSHFVVTLTATDCQTGEALARTQAEATSKERVLTELGAISSSMRTKLGESLPSIRRFDVPIEQATTPSLAALKAYTLGQEERRRGRELESVAFFNQAIENDREFAAAYITLSTVYGSLGEWRRSEEFAKRANAVTRPLSERERLLIAYQYHDRVWPPKRSSCGRRHILAISDLPTRSQ
jgi:carbonic anhydrase